MRIAKEPRGTLKQMWNTITDRQSQTIQHTQSPSIHLREETR